MEDLCVCGHLLDEHEENGKCQVGECPCWLYERAVEE
jgi:hypothetical protein